MAKAQTVRSGLFDFWRDRRGNFAALTALAALPVMFAVGGAVDLNLYYTNKTKIQNAADAAALAAAKRFPFDPDEARIKQFADAYFQANAGGLYRTEANLDYRGVTYNEANVRELEIAVEFKYQPLFLPVMAEEFAGMGGQASTVTSVVAIGNTTVEMAMVLDTSGSMNDVPAGGGGSKISALRTIASDAIDQLFGGGQMSGVDEPVRISVVPFAGAVNLGVPLSTWWLDPKGLHPNHHDHLYWDRYNYTVIPADYREPPAGQVASASWLNARYQANQIAIRDPNSTLSMNRRPWVRKDDHKVYLTRAHILSNMGANTPSFNLNACPPGYVLPALAVCRWEGGPGYGTWILRNLAFPTNNEVCRQSNDATCHPPYTMSKPTNLFFAQSQDLRVCAETRSGPYALTNQLPNEADPASMFLPYFAPDEYDGTSFNFGNPYLRDGQTSESASWLHPLRNRPLFNVSWDLKQRDVRKYLMQPDRLYSSTTTNNGRSPNYICESDALVPLSSNPEKARSRVKALNATGATNVEEGLGWGWRTVTAAEPFAGGRAHGDENNFKAIVVMTDGANTYYANSSENRSGYGAYGYAADKRIFEHTTYATMTNPPYTNDAFQNAMDQRTAKLCENVKNDGRVAVKTASGEAVKDGSGRSVTRDGVLIYTIAFDIPAADKARVDRLLRNCASASIGDQMTGKPLADSSRYFYSASSNAELKKAFSDIVASLSSLRIAR